ncbi:hypothetical protein TNCV_4951271 [Trichonephila clavipes]|nr:hypothetical protein TNCV_4951271 [Trichonephila clavipes]
MMRYLYHSATAASVGLEEIKNAKNRDFLCSCTFLIIEPSGLMQSQLLGREERNDLQKFIWGADNSLRAVEHMNTVSSECLENV